VEISVAGRHDPCIVPRIIPVAEAMLALVLADCILSDAVFR
jgi:chorismate synthase